MVRVLCVFGLLLLGWFVVPNPTENFAMKDSDQFAQDRVAQGKPVEIDGKRHDGLPAKNL